MAKKIRVRLSGLALFIGNILSFLLGFVFIVLVSRKLSQEDLGAWFFIGSLLTYFQVLEKVLPYWVIRDSARGAKIVKTSSFFNLLISIPLLASFLCASYAMSDTVGIDVILFLIASLLLPIYYVQAPVTSVIYATRPHLASLRNPMIDGVKILLALLLLPYGLKGVLVAVIIANLVYLIYSIAIVRDCIEDRLRIDWLKSRIRHAWLPLFRSASGYVNSASDSFLVGILLSPIDLSYYGIGITISNAIRSSAQMSLPFSVKLLAKEETNQREIRSLFKFILIFVIPMLLGGIVLAPNLFGIFGRAYVKGAWILPPLLLAAVFSTYSSALGEMLKGLEKIDKSLEVGYRDLLRSKLFAVDSLDYLSTGILITLSVILIPPMGGFGAAFSRLVASIIISLILTYMSRQYLPFRRLAVDLAKIIVACLPMIVFLMLFKPVGSIRTFISIAAGAAIYFASLYAIDSESRKLIKLFLNELSRRAHFSKELAL